MIAVNDGRVVKIGRSRRLGRFVMLQDVYGNTYTYGHLGEVEHLPGAQGPLRAPPQGRASRARDADPANAAPEREPAGARRPRRPRPRPPLPAKERLFANPTRPAARAAGGDMQLAPTPKR